MGNLKGSDFGRQIKNAQARLEARGTSRHETSSSKTHSHAVATKREMYLNDFAKYAESKELEGKLNEHMTQDNMREFLDNRLLDVSPKTALDYTSGFNSMIKGLEETRVGIPNETKEYLQEIRADYQREFNDVRGDYESGRSLSDSEAFKADLSNIREESEVIATLQLETGLRVSEALEVVSNFDKYYNPDDNTLSNVVGKGGQGYHEKDISPHLAEKILEMDKVPSYSTYNQDLSKLDTNSHDLRITYAVEAYKEKLDNGHSHNEAMKEVSEELNHHRESITQYYLNRA